MGKYPRKPRARKLPKRPKQSASLEVWNNFKKRCQDIQKENRKKLTEWESAKKKIDSDLSKKAKLIKSTQGLKGI